MSALPKPTPIGQTASADSYCNVCSVTRDADQVLIHFGELVQSVLDPRSQGVALRHRVGLDESTAGRLHDLTSALLAELDRQ